jgi:hypothetical protein
MNLRFPIDFGYRWPVPVSADERRILETEVGWEPFTMRKNYGEEFWVGMLSPDKAMVIWLGRWKRAAAKLVSREGT